MAELVMPNGKPQASQVTTTLGQQQQPKTSNPTAFDGGYRERYGGLAAEVQPGGPPPAPAPSYTSTYQSDPNAGLSSLQQKFKQKFGRDMTPQEQQMLQGYAGYQSGNITQDQWNKANYAVENYSGNVGNPGVGTMPTGQPQPQQGGQNVPTTGSGKTVTGVPESYNAGVFVQPQPYANPYQQQQQNLMNSILQNPQTLSQQVQDQMYEQQKQQALDMNKQFGMQVRQNTAGRGLSGGGGATQAMLNEGNQKTAEALLGGRRDVAIKAATQNRADELNALQAAQGLSDADFAQYLQQQGMNLDIFNTDESNKQRAAASALENSQFEYQQRDDDRAKQLQEWLARTQGDLEQQKLRQQNQQFNQTYGLDFLRYLQDDKHFGSDLAERIRQFNEQMGFNWAGQQQQAYASNNNLINSILGR